jgi:hypothetical protein
MSKRLFGWSKSNEIPAENNYEESSNRRKKGCGLQSEEGVKTREIKYLNTQKMRRKPAG